MLVSVSKVHFLLLNPTDHIGHQHDFPCALSGLHRRAVFFTVVGKLLHMQCDCTASPCTIRLMNGGVMPPHLIACVNTWGFLVHMIHSSDHRDSLCSAVLKQHDDSKVERQPIVTAMSESCQCCYLASTSSLGC